MLTIHHPGYRVVSRRDVPSDGMIDPNVRASDACIPRRESLESGNVVRLDSSVPISPSINDKELLYPEQQASRTRAKSMTFDEIPT